MVKPSILNIGVDPAHPILATIQMANRPTPTQVSQAITDTRVKMKELGYEDFKSQVIDPDNHMQEVTNLLNERSWDAVVIGGGFKMVPALNSQLEDIINLIKDKSPKSRILFTMTPDGVPQAVKRLDE